MEDKTYQILSCFADVMKDNGFRAELMKDETGVNPPLLRVETRDNGKIRQDVIYEICFVPLKMQRDTTALMQFYITLLTGMPEQHFSEVSKACDYCNGFNALGNFALFRPAGQIFLKQNVVIDLETELEAQMNLIVDNMALLMTSVTNFIDPLAQIASGVSTLDAAIGSGLLPGYGKAFDEIEDAALAEEEKQG